MFLVCVWLQVCVPSQVCSIQFPYQSTVHVVVNPTKIALLPSQKSLHGLNLARQTDVLKM